MIRANVNATLVKEVTADLGSVGAAATATTTVTVPGVKANNFYLVAFTNAALNAGLLIQPVIKCEADDQLIVRAVNPTAGAINAAAATLAVIGV